MWAAPWLLNLINNPPPPMPGLILKGAVYKPQIDKPGVFKPQIRKGAVHKPQISKGAVFNG